MRREGNSILKSALWDYWGPRGNSDILFADRQSQPGPPCLAYRWPNYQLAIYRHCPGSSEWENLSQNALFPAFASLGSSVLARRGKADRKVPAKYSWPRNCAGCHSMTTHGSALDLRN